MNLEELFRSRNFLQMLGNAGETISKGGTIGEALNPASTIQDIIQQQALGEMLKQIFPQTNTQANLTPKTGGVPYADAKPYEMPETPGMQNVLDAFKGVTPVGKDGIDGITHNVSPTGSTTTIKNSPNSQGSTFGTSVPAEAQVAGGGVQKERRNPFLSALLG